MSCSNNCIFCFDKKSKLNLKITPEIIRKSELKLYLDTLRLISEGERSVSITGDEILRYDKIIEYLNWIRDKFDFISISDPCLSLEDETFTKRLIDSGIDEVCFSIYGSNPEIHDSCVGNKGAFDKLVKAMDNLNEVQKKRPLSIKIHSLFLKQNFGDFNKMISFLEMKKMRLNSVSFPRVHPLTKNCESFLFSDSTDFKKDILDISRISKYEVDVFGILPCIFNNQELLSLNKIVFKNSSHKFTVNYMKSGSSPELMEYVGFSYYSSCEKCHLKKLELCGGFPNSFKVEGILLNPISEYTFLNIADRLIFFDTHPFYQQFTYENDSLKKYTFKELLE